MQPKIYFNFNMIYQLKNMYYANEEYTYSSFA